MSAPTYGHWPPAARRALLRRALRDCRALTLQQLTWRGLAGTVDELGLARVTLTSKPRSSQSPIYDLEYVGSAEQLTRPETALKHYAGLGELWFPADWRAGGQWRLVDASDRRIGALPDAEVLWPSGQGEDVAVEFDAGYTTEKILRKLLALHDQGYPSILWGTTVHGRVSRLGGLTRRLAAQGRLPHLRTFEARYTDIWSATDPYRPRPRCHKANAVRLTFPTADDARAGESRPADDSPYD